MRSSPLPWRNVYGFLLCLVTWSIRGQRGSGDDTAPEHLSLQKPYKPPPACMEEIYVTKTGTIQSPSYPRQYPLDTECIYILTAPEGFVIQVDFHGMFDIERSYNCKYDHVELRDGMYGFSPLIGRYCGDNAPAPVKTTGNKLWVKFYSDWVIEGAGFEMRYRPEPDRTVRKKEPDCNFRVSGINGTAASSSLRPLIDRFPTLPDGLDCTWIISVPYGYKVNLRFTEWDLGHFNQCDRSYVEVYDRTSVVEEMAARYCGNQAPDLQSRSNVIFIRYWMRYDEEQLYTGTFRALFTAYEDPEGGRCKPGMFSCIGQMCINESLVCNGEQNCHYPWDEQKCEEPSGTPPISDENLVTFGIASSVVGLILIGAIVLGCRQPRRRPAGGKPHQNVNLPAKREMNHCSIAGGNPTMNCDMNQQQTLELVSMSLFESPIKPDGPNVDRYPPRVPSMVTFSPVSSPGRCLEDDYESPPRLPNADVHRCWSRSSSRSLTGGGGGRYSVAARDDTHGELQNDTEEPPPPPPIDIQQELEPLPVTVINDYCSQPLPTVEEVSGSEEEAERIEIQVQDPQMVRSTTV
ncbi:neuropilin and tolloid-like protein 2 isoform X1 [Branchiostoma floridae]|uniref:Neuropilin and tolloid-like protein 2 isoform X1 n=1 Tax=Branchiostoma floridae TaxID=7739 RepID=A0A9J7LCB9_BRAFL|nr:neuropilin and tolloid-like protein 2 isoform X1 [Branchiostoma floridae]XP_035679571.1 neuropilin and tolloid-like protein 2 isoform X1 [Branchiostoma floridae]